LDVEHVRFRNYKKFNRKKVLSEKAGDLSAANGSIDIASQMAHGDVAAHNSINVINRLRVTSEENFSCFPRVVT
jgi:hypothetical protein